MTLGGSGPENVPTREAGAPPKLSHQALLAAQVETLETPRRHYGAAARALFVLLDIVYGRGRTLSKFKVLEIVARVPYQSWEQVAYIAVTHVSGRTALARRIHDRVLETRAQQDNEAWHLLVLEELTSQIGDREGLLRFGVIPQILAFAYYQLSFMLYVVRPRWSYRLNADFEDHAEHEYMTMVTEHPEWEVERFESSFADIYGSFDSLADLFRQIAHDERVHKQESLAAVAEARFS